MAGSTRSTRSRGVRIGVIVVAMVVVAEGAVWLLGPDDPQIDAEHVSEAEYFNAAEVERARDYHSGQRLLLLAGVGLQTVALVTFALGRPRSARDVLDRLEARPVLGGAAAGAGLSLAIAVVALPTDIWAHERSVDVGLSTQSIGPWLGDYVKASVVGAVLAAGGAALLLALIRRTGRNWWLPGAAGVVGLSAIFSWLAPVVLAPLFNDFDPLPEESRARAEVLGLGERAGVDIGEVYSVDASRRSTALNAYVGGLGPTKRVVLYDTLLDRAKTDELRSVVAHELGHVDHHDIPRGIAFVALIAPLGLLFAREVSDGLNERSGAPSGSPAALPAYALALGLASFVLSVPGNQLSREVERSADIFALELTDDPEGLIDLQKELTVSNVSDPDPPSALTFLFGTHPPAIERIGLAKAYEDTVPRN